MYQVVQVRLREAGKVLYCDTQSIPVKTGDFVIVEQERGMEYGEVLTDPEIMLDSAIEKPLRKIARVATDDAIATVPASATPAASCAPTASATPAQSASALL